MEEELSDMEEDELDVPEDASSYSEFSPIEASDEVPVHHIEDADVEVSESDAESTFEGGIGYTTEIGELSRSRPGEEGIFVWEGGAYEESVYGGEFSRYEDESEGEKPSPVQASSPTKSSSRVTLQVPSSSTSYSKKSALKTKSSTASVHRLQTTSSRLKIERPQEKPCVRDRMRKWLNRDATVEPHQESFLGVPYSEREQTLDVEDPCRHVSKGDGSRIAADT